MQILIERKRQIRTGWRVGGEKIDKRSEAERDGGSRYHANETNVKRKGRRMDIDMEREREGGRREGGRDRERERERYKLITK